MGVDASGRTVALSQRCDATGCVWLPGTGGAHLETGSRLEPVSVVACRQAGNGFRAGRMGREAPARRATRRGTAGEDAESTGYQYRYARFQPGTSSYN
jgi:hypothetical protein